MGIIYQSLLFEREHQYVASISSRHMYQFLHDFFNLSNALHHHNILKELVCSVRACTMVRTGARHCNLAILMIS